MAPVAPGRSQHGDRTALPYHKGRRLEGIPASTHAFAAGGASRCEPLPPPSDTAAQASVLFSDPAASMYPRDWAYAAETRIPLSARSETAIRLHRYALDSTRSSLLSPANAPSEYCEPLDSGPAAGALAVTPCAHRACHGGFCAPLRAFALQGGALSN